MGNIKKVLIGLLLFNSFCLFSQELPSLLEEPVQPAPSYMSNTKVANLWIWAQQARANELQLRDIITQLQNNQPAPTPTPAPENPSEVVAYGNQARIINVTKDTISLYVDAVVSFDDNVWPIPEGSLYKFKTYKTETNGIPAEGVWNGKYIIINFEKTDAVVSPPVVEPPKDPFSISILPLNYVNFKDNDVGDQRVGVDDSGGAIGWFDEGEWVEYEINIPYSSNVILSLEMSCPGDGSQVKIYINGQEKALINVPNTGDWSAFQTISTELSLNAGSQILRIEGYKESSIFWVGDLKTIKINSK